MQIIISGKGMDLTEAIKSYVDKKISGLDKFHPNILRASVEVGKENHHHLKGEVFIAECKIEIPGNDVFASKNEKTLFKAIDKVRDYLELELKKSKAKAHDVNKKEKRLARESKEYSPE